MGEQNDIVTIRKIAQSLYAEIKADGGHICVRAEQLAQMQTTLNSIDEKLTDMKSHEQRIGKIETTLNIVSVIIAGSWIILVFMWDKVTFK